MRVLLIKMSSLGDVFHALPALTDARQAIPEIQFDWVVEEAFADIPSWHPAVRRVVPIAWRRWRRSLTDRNTRVQLRAFWADLRREPYDLVLDAQGLVKSAVVASCARGTRCGLDRESARESLASCVYRRKIPVARDQHAIPRLRQLFAQCLGYPLPDTPVNYGVERTRFTAPATEKPYLVLLHGTSWDTKLWPESCWTELCTIAAAAGFELRLLWGSDAERARATRIAATQPAARVLDRLSLTQAAQLLAHAAGVVGVDTGLAHVAAALDVPLVAIYGATDPKLTGVLGTRVAIERSQFFCAPCIARDCRHARGASAVFPPCYQEITPQRVWAALQAQMRR